ncbi:unnamed protein product, partial [Mesorhabditis belari]|uniref:Uncharacterized protein n=1 Tax=Mesorhabditis belari TaxID=2138241 RepID=A0AAF3EAU2_9BILA
MLGILALLCGLFYLLAAFLIVTYCVRDRDDTEPPMPVNPMVSIIISKDSNSCARHDSITTQSIPTFP